MAHPRTIEVMYAPEVLVDGKWEWPLNGMLMPRTLEAALAQFDALDVEPWRTAQRRVTLVVHCTEVVWP